MHRVVLALALILLLSPRLQAQAPFYQGKTIKFVAGYGAGSVDDMWARLVAQYMVKYIPGNPNIRCAKYGGRKLSDRSQLRF